MTGTSGKGGTNIKVVHPVDVDSADGADAPRTDMSSASALGSNLRRRDHLVNDAIVKVKTREHVGKPVEEQADQTVDMFIKVKLREWDKDQSGCFSREEVENAMEEYRETLANLAKLKWQVVICTIALASALLVGLGAAAIAYTLAKSTSVSSSGSLQRRGSSESVVTTVQSGVGDLPTVLSFDDVTDDWDIDDSGLRSLDSVSFTATNGTFFHFKVAELRRFDSGPEGSTDQLDIVTEGGHQLRFIEIADGFQELEVKWKGTVQWRTIPTSTAATRRLEAVEAVEDDDQEDDDDHPQPSGAVDPPARLLSKGHYVGGVYIHSRGGHYECDPAYIDGYHNPDYYCNNANLFVRSLWLRVLFLAHCLGYSCWN
mmetsp:Transcript_29505/g.84473  ORF Transcript_29505/g.84473 Transcript_29505/m.84473 type:complete len:372 (+) Transcript_29505:79-1194(+)